MADPITEMVAALHQALEQQGLVSGEQGDVDVEPVARAAWKLALDVLDDLNATVDFNGESGAAFLYEARREILPG
jgi:hypothetical protein